MGRRATLAELCEHFRATESQTIFGESLIADRPEAKKLLAALALAPLPPWRCPSSLQPADDRMLWLWVWSGYPNGPHAPQFLDSLARLALVSVETAYRVWPSIMISRVLYPDGTLSAAGQIMLKIPIRRGPGRPRKGEERGAIQLAQPTTAEGEKNGDQ